MTAEAGPPEPGACAPTVRPLWPEEQAVQDRLAELTAAHGPLRAAQLLFGGPGAPRPVPAPRRAPDAAAPPVIVQRTVAGQRALIAARARQERSRGLALVQRWLGR